MDGAIDKLEHEKSATKPTQLEFERLNEIMERLLTAKETAKLWSCCTETVLRKIRRGEIEAVYIAGRAPRIRESTIAKYVREHVRGGVTK